MNKLKNAIIFGKGRCGSHWVEAIVIDLLGGIGQSHSDVQLMPHGWVLHTHNLIELIKCPREVRESTMLILCSRENKFDQSISYHIAQKTNEWFVYSDKQIAPFTIDPVAFEDTLTSTLISEKFDGYRDLPKLWPNLINIKYEDLANSEIPEKYVAECLGMAYKKTEGWAQQGAKKNPRNYQNLILNWDELVAISKKYVA